MRRLIYPAIFVMLVAALVLLWSRRFERIPETVEIRLSDLVGRAELAAGASWSGTPDRPVLRLEADPAGHGRVVRCELPELKGVRFLRARFEISATGLEQGMLQWQDGRGMIEWHDPTGATDWERDGIFSTRGSHPSAGGEIVMRPKRGTADPALRIEHLGKSGVMEISKIELAVLRERPLWSIGRWGLLAGWFFWIFVLIRGQNPHDPGRTGLAAAIWLLMGLCFVVPGPWKGLKPLVIPFDFGIEAPASGQAAAVGSLPEPPSAEESGRIAPAGQIPPGDVTLWIKAQVAKAKSLLHLLLLFAPTFATAWLVGCRRAMPIAVIFALAVEAAQLAFGYGFDIQDVTDLSCDTMGIILGLKTCEWLRGGFPRKAAARLSRAKATPALEQ